MKKAVLIFSILIMIAVIAVCVFMQDRNSVNSVELTVPAGGGAAQNIRLYKGDGKYYAFLPSYADMDTVTIRYNAAALYLDGKHYASSGCLSDVVTNREYSLSIKSRFGMQVCDAGLIFMKGGDVSSLSITLTDGSLKDINKSKDVSKTGSMTIINADKTVDFNGSFKDIHGRGNSTWPQSKKPYIVEFSQSVDLLGMGAGKKWILLANAFDESGLRNKLAYDIAKEIGVDFAVDSEYVDLYVNNEYLGLYLLTEKVEVGKNRVNISSLSENTQSVNYKPLSAYDQYEVTEDQKIKRGYNIPRVPEEITGGYLLEVKHDYVGPAEEKSMFQTDELYFIISAPKYADKKQVDYISSLFNNTEQKLKQGDTSGVDLESFVNYYLVQEVFANVDPNSSFFYKDIDSADTKIHACSVWDLDLTIGNSWYKADMPHDVLYQSMENWFPYLYRSQEFKELLKERYVSFFKADINKALFDKIELYRNRINGSFDMNKARWKLYYEDKGLLVCQSQNLFDTLDEHVEHITDFMKKRIAFLDSAWLDGEEYHYVCFKDMYLKKWYTLKQGETINEAPVPFTEPGSDKRFLGWFDEEGGEFLPGMEITRSEKYAARWESLEDNSKDESTKR